MTKTILIIDDHPDTMDLIQLSLRRYGYRLLAVETGRDGIERAREVTPDLILLDIMMPDMNGYEVCRALREDPRLQKTPIIMFSAKSQAGDKLEGFNVGADDYLIKPTRPAELARRVEAMLNRDAPYVPEPDGSDDSPTGRLIVTLGSRGGAGSTTTAINLAAALADEAERTVLVDCDFHQGHVAAYLNQLPRLDLTRLLETTADSFREQFRRSLISYAPYWQLLTVEAGRRDSSLLASPQMTRLLDLIREESHYVLLDLGRYTGERAHDILRRADHIIICLRPERLSIQSTKELVEHLRRALHRPDALHTLMLDFNTGSTLPRVAVESFLGFPLLDVISIYGEEMAQATNHGQPLLRVRPLSGATQKFKQLAIQFQTADNRA